MSSDPLLSVTGLKKHFDDGTSTLDKILNIENPPVRAVDGVDFEIRKGQTFGLVGESGCGKSTTGQTILRLLEPTAGRAEFRGDNIYDMDGAELNEFRRNAQIVFQDPFSSLNPRMTVGDIIREPLKIHGVGAKEERREKAEEMLQHVGLSADQIDRYPHEFSGGQRQRICIARSLALEPDFIVLDEPVSALDVSVQAQILNLLNDLQEEFDLTYLFIAHDLGVVKYICDQVGVMYLGKMVEVGPTDAIFDAPQHPYTQALLDSIPDSHVSEEKKDIDGLPGEVPSPRNPPKGCSFHTRCERVILPESIDVERNAFRTIMDFRYQLSHDAERFDEYTVSKPREASEDAVSRRVEELREAFDMEFELADRGAERALTEAARDIVTEDYAAARDRLDETFTTVCRAKEPELVETTSSDHRSACFLSYDDPPELLERSTVEARPRGD